MCPFSTLNTSQDLVPTDVVFPHFVEESFEVQPSPRQEWYFRSNATSDEVTLLKVFDNSKTAGVAFCI